MKLQSTFVSAVIFISLFLLLIGCQNEKDKEIIALKKAIKDLQVEKLDTLADLSDVNIKDGNQISISDLKTILSFTTLTTKLRIEEILQKQRLNKYIDGEPTTNDELARIFSSRNTNETEYIYYFKEDFEKLLNAGNCPENSQRGIRIYLATVNPDHRLPSDQSKIHPYAGKRTVYLQSMCGNERIIATEEIHSLYDFGDVCPPNCNNTDKKGDRTPDQMRDGVKAN